MSERVTIKNLSQLYCLNREIERDKRRLAELETAAQPDTAKITGMPHGNGRVTKPVGMQRRFRPAGHNCCEVWYDRI